MCVGVLLGCTACYHRVCVLERTLCCIELCCDLAYQLLGAAALRCRLPVLLRWRALTWRKLALFIDLSSLSLTVCIHPVITCSLAVQPCARICVYVALCAGDGR
jgi:hypothetical protein